MRRPYVAGSFYPSDVDDLSSLLTHVFSHAKEVEVDGQLRALVVPHAAIMFSGYVAASAYKLMSKHLDEIERIVLLGPSHYFSYEGSFSTFYDVWSFPFGEVSVRRYPSFPPNEEVHAVEHSLEVQFPFLWYIGAIEKEIFPIAVALDDPVRVSNILKDEQFIIVSTDLSHYHSYEKAKEIDRYANECIPSLQLECVYKKVEACGKLPLLSLMHLASKKGWKGLFIDYMNSGDVYKMDKVVGYGAYAFFE